MSKQESVSDWMGLAKAFDKAEKETVQPYVFVSIEDSEAQEKLYHYDIPREMFWRYDWVIRWRIAKFQCQRPKHHINQFLSFYDKKTGLEYGFGSLLSKLVSAKAQITATENKIADYKERMKDDLFFDESTDPIIAKLRCKIETQKGKIRDYENEIKSKLKKLEKDEK
ncbi:MAG: hypothetical protein IKH61_12990 [Bacteroidales bacterium]|nr:hypothetical protein [Bacteroidales bacterium]